MPPNIITLRLITIFPKLLQLVKRTARIQSKGKNVTVYSKLPPEILVQNIKISNLGLPQPVY
jgi:hypothetical protein